MKGRRFKSIISIILLLSLLISPFAKTNAYGMNMTRSMNRKNPLSQMDLSSTMNSSINNVANFELEFTIVNQWQGAFNGRITITNNGYEPIRNWSLMFVSDDIITDIWNASIVSYDGGLYHIKNDNWNSDINPGENVDFEFTATTVGDVDIPISYYMPTKNQIVNPSEYKVDFSVDSDWERPDVGDTSIIDNHGPSRPSNLYVVAVSGSALTLSWSASVDNVGVEGYKIFRDGIEIGLVSDIFYTDATVIEGNTYQYTVQAYDASNNCSEISEPLSVAIEEREKKYLMHQLIYEWILGMKVK